MELPREIWEKRRDLLRKARDGKLNFAEFCMLDMHKETTDLLAKNKPTLSEKGLMTLGTIESYLDVTEAK